MMINDNLNKLLDIKAEIKTALISNNISEPGDNFRLYPDMVKSLNWDRKPDIVDEYFTKLDNEYFEREETIDGIEYTIFYQKYSYNYGETIISGEEVYRQKKEEARYILDVETIDDSEIEIEYSDGVLKTENGKLEYPLEPYSGSFISVKNWDKIKIVNTANIDWLPGNAQNYKFGGSSSAHNTNLVAINELICRESESLDNFSRYCDNLTTIRLYISEICTSITYFADNCPNLKYGYIYGGAKGSYKNCFTGSSSNPTKPEEITVDISGATNLGQFMQYCYPKRINFINGLPPSSSSYTYFCNSNTNTEEINGIDFTGVTNVSTANIFSYFPNLKYCKVLGIGKATTANTTYMLPDSEYWVDEDKEFTFWNFNYWCNGNSNNGNLAYNKNYTPYILANPDLIMYLYGKGWVIYISTSSNGYRYYYQNIVSYCKSIDNYNVEDIVLKYSSNGTSVTTVKYDTDGFYSGTLGNSSNSTNYPNSYISIDDDSKPYVREFNIRFTYYKIFTNIYLNDMSEIELIQLPGGYYKNVDIHNCPKLKKIYFPDDPANLVFLDGSFLNCPELTEFDNLKENSLQPQNWDLSETNISKESFAKLVNSMAVADNQTITLPFWFDLDNDIMAIATQKGYTITR